MEILGINKSIKFEIKTKPAIKYKNKIKYHSIPLLPKEKLNLLRGLAKPLDTCAC